MVDFFENIYYNTIVIIAGVMELADVTDSKSVDGDIVWVRVPPPAPLKDVTFDTKMAWRKPLNIRGFLLFCVKNEAAQRA